MTAAVWVVFSYGDPMPITACATPELAERYAAALALLPDSHPLYTADALVDELPLNHQLPAPLAALDHRLDDPPLGVGEDSRSSSPVAPDGPDDVAATLRFALVNLRETVAFYVSDDVGMPELADAMDKAYAALYPDADLRVADSEA